MDVTPTHFLEIYTIRERCAFALLLAERAARVLAHDSRLAPRVAQALDVAWAWTEAQPIAGNQIVDEFVLRDDDTGLAVESFSEPRTMHGMEAIITALLYVAWHAFGQAGVSAVTDPVNECSEACIDIIISDALASGAVDADVLTAVRRALVQAASTSPAIARYYAPHLLGPPINRTVLRALLAEGGTWTTGSSTHLPVDGPPSPAAMR